MDPPEDFPPKRAIPLLHDKNPKQKPCVTTTNHPINTNEDIALFNEFTAPSLKKTNF